MNSRVWKTGGILQCRAANHLQREAKRRKSASCWVWARTTRPAATWPQTPELWLQCTVVWMRQWSTQKPQTGSPISEIRQNTRNVTATNEKWTENVDGMCSTFLFLATHCPPVHAEKEEEFAPVSHHISYTKCVLSWWCVNVLTSSATFSIPLLDLRKVASTSTGGFVFWSSAMMIPTSFEKKKTTRRFLKRVISFKLFRKWLLVTICATFWHEQLLSCFSVTHDNTVRMFQYSLNS